MSKAQYIVGFMYFQGEGVPQDYVNAHMWASLAASVTTGDEHNKCSGLRDSIAAKMTPQQIAEAQLLTRQ